MTRRADERRTVDTRKTRTYSVSGFVQFTQCLCVFDVTNATTSLAWRTPQGDGQGRRDGCVVSRQFWCSRTTGLTCLTVFVDGPIVLQPVDLDGHTANALGASEATAETSDPALTPRAWYKANPDRTVARGLEDALQTLRDVLLRDRYVVSVYARVLQRIQAEVSFLRGYFWV